MGISANIAGWRCRNEHAEKSENIEKEKLANQSAIKQQGSLSKKLKKTSGSSSYWVMNGYCAPRLTQIRPVTWVRKSAPQMIIWGMMELGSSPKCSGPKPCVCPKWQNGPQNAQKNMTYYDQHWPTSHFSQFFPYFFMGPKSGPREPPYSNDVQVTHTLVVLINEFLLWAI